MSTFSALTITLALITSFFIAPSQERSRSSNIKRLGRICNGNKSPCSCYNTTVDCSFLDLTNIPFDLSPFFVDYVNFRGNKFININTSWLPRTCTSVMLDNDVPICHSNISTPTCVIMCYSADGEEDGMLFIYLDKYILYMYVIFYYDKPHFTLYLSA